MFKALNNLCKTIAITGLMWMGFDYFWGKTLEFVKEFKLHYVKK